MPCQCIKWKAVKIPHGKLDKSPRKEERTWKRKHQQNQRHHKGILPSAASSINSQPHDHQSRANHKNGNIQPLLADWFKCFQFLLWRLQWFFWAIFQPKRMTTTPQPTSPSPFSSANAPHLWANTTFSHYPLIVSGVTTFTDAKRIISMFRHFVYNQMLDHIFSFCHFQWPDAPTSWLPGFKSQFAIMAQRQYSAA